MALYATLRGASVSCPACGQPAGKDWQFYFGAVSQLPDYQLGDRIRWGSGCYGNPSMDPVYAVAYSIDEPSCVHCGGGPILAELLIEQGIIVGLTAALPGVYRAELLYEGTNRTPRYFDELWSDDTQ